MSGEADSRALRELAAGARAAAVFALDTEFMGEGRYRTLLCLVQLAVPEAAQHHGNPSDIIRRVVARNDPPAHTYRALRRLQAQSEHFGASAWMDVWTTVDPVAGFRYDIVGEGGTSYVRVHVLRPWLDGEKQAWASGDPERASLTFENYAFDDRGLTADGLAWLGVMARRKDVLLVDGSIYVNAVDGDLVRIEGRLSKAPSFWTRRVEVVRYYRRINGIRVPVAIESVANVLLAGRSTFKMTYEYETINGVHVGAPLPRADQAPRSDLLIH